MTGNIFRGHVQDALFNIVTILTDQKIHLLGMMTEAIHTPFLSDRFLAIQNAQYIFRTMKDLGSEIVFKEGGIMQTRSSPRPPICWGTSSSSAFLRRWRRAFLPTSSGPATAARAWMACSRRRPGTAIPSWSP